MKLSKTRLKQVIKEEVEKHLKKEARIDIPGLPGRPLDSSDMNEVMKDIIITGFSEFIQADPSEVLEALKAFNKVDSLVHGGDDHAFGQKYIYPVMLKSRKIIKKAAGGPTDLGKKIDGKTAMRMALGLEK